MTHIELCDGLDLRCCVTCARNVDNNPGEYPERTTTPDPIAALRGLEGHSDARHRCVAREVVMGTFFGCIVGIAACLLAVLWWYANGVDDL